MVGTRDYIRGGLSISLGNDPARTRRTGQVTRNQLSYGIVGHEEPSPAYVEIRNGQAWVEVTMRPEGDEIVARLGLPSAGAASGWFLPLSFGCRVVLELVDGDPNGAIIVARLNDEECALPATACGVSTGAGGIIDEAAAPAPAWQFSVLPSGQLLAIETQGTGDVMIYSGASMEFKTGGATNRIHLNGPVSLGEGPVSAPVGGTVLPGGKDAPATPMVSHVPAPFAPTLGVPPDGIDAYTGTFADAVVRAKEAYQSNIAIDPNFWAKLVAIATNPLIGVGPIISMTSTISSAGTPARSGSTHTASD